MGMGHLRRCLSLADTLRARGDCVRIVTRSLGLDSIALIAEQKFENVHLLSEADGKTVSDPAIPHAAWAEVPQRQDIDETVAALAEFSPDFVIVDSYSFDARWHLGVRQRLQSGIVQIDDVADRRIAPDLLIDHNYATDHKRKYLGSVADEVKILGGPRYALLGPRFALAPRYEFSRRVRSVGIFMGGVDAGGHSATVLAALRDTGFAGAIEIVTTGANPHLQELIAVADADSSVTLSINLTDLADFFARHDLQVGAGGGATWERCCIGVPTLLVVVACNQRAVAPGLAEQGVVALADAPDRITLGNALEELIQDADTRHDLAQRARQLVDGRGAARVVEEMRCFA
jgi:UDP-2,4-diacetamido-2,4,6-trideoxy-beta-L-altropyranose hydrolase|tara:strand:- start:3312 stop:4349 length:1038 start_codon:yes stop_codon:yes gene_type:complete